MNLTNRSVVQKHPRVRVRKLLDLAHVIPCMFTFPHECRGDSMACHGNWQHLGKGVGLKTSDWIWAAGCLIAHREIDGKIKPTMTKEQREYEWLNAFIGTHDYIWQNRLVRIA